MPLELSETVDISWFGSLSKLLKTTSWVLRFINNLKATREGAERKIGDIDANEIHVAENHWVREAQKELLKLPKYKDLMLQLGI